MPSAPSSPRSRFVGVRLPLVVGFVSSLGALAALGAYTLLSAETARAIQALVDDLEAKAQAGRGALAALDAAEAEVRASRQQLWIAQQRAAERRASELVLLATLHPDELPPVFAPRDGELVGYLSAEGDRFDGLGSAATTTLSVAHPELASALAGAPADLKGPLIVRGRQGVYAVASGARRRPAAFVPLAMPSPQPDALVRARGVVGSLAEPWELPVWIVRPEPIFIGAALFAAVIAAWWVRRRVSEPLLETLDAARGFVHGEASARADPKRGGREAREVARAVNGLVEQAVRLQDKGRAAREEDIQAAAVAIEQLGKGDLRGATPRLQAPFVPVSRALDGARRDLLARVGRLHEVASSVARDATEVAPGARRLEAGTEAQCQALERLGRSIEDAHHQVQTGEARLKTAVEALSHAATDQRRANQDLKSTLSLVSRRVGDLTAIASRLHGLAGSAQALEQALALLSTWAASDTPDDKARARATVVVGEGHAALKTLTRDLGEVQAELATAADTLSMLGESQLEPPPDPARAGRAPAYEAAAALVRAAELTDEALGGWIRAARGLSQDAGRIAAGAQAASQRLPELSEALSELRVGDAFEEVLLERLETARADIEAAGANGLSPDGEALMQDVVQAAEAARARVTRLIRATEATLDILRG